MPARRLRWRPPASRYARHPTELRRLSSALGFECNVITPNCHICARPEAIAAGSVLPIVDFRRTNPGETSMPSRPAFVVASAAIGLLATTQLHAQTQPTQPAAPSRPPIETTKVEGTDNVYIFRNV